MASIITTSSDIPIEFQGYYDRTLLENAMPALLFDMFGQIRPLPKNMGARINFRRYGKLPVNTTPLTEGVTPTGKKLSTSDIYAVIQFYGDYIVLSDVLLTLGLDANILDIAENVLSDQAGETKDILARDVLVAGTSVRRAGSVAARTSIIDKFNDADVEAVVSEMERSNTKKLRGINVAGKGVGTSPIGATFIAVTHTDSRKAVESLDGFIPVYEYPTRDALSNYKGEVVEIGYAHGIRWLATTHGKIWADGGGTAVTNGLKYTTASTACDVYGTLIFGKNAYGTIPLQKDTIKTIVKQLGHGEDPLDQRASVGYKFADATKILNEEWIYRIEHGNPSL